VPSSFNNTSAPLASNTTSPAVSIIKSPVSFTIYELVPPWYKLRSSPAPIVNLPVALSPVKSSASASTSNFNNPPDVILDAPLSMLPKPEAIEPEANAPTVVAAVVTRLGIAVISSSKYAAKSVTAT